MYRRFTVVSASLTGSPPPGQRRNAAEDTSRHSVGMAVEHALVRGPAPEGMDSVGMAVQQVLAGKPAPEGGVSVRVAVQQAHVG